MPTASLKRDTRDERRSLNFRMPSKAVDLIDRAAARAHKDRTEFVLEASVARAQEVLLDQTVFPLSGPDFDAFVAALDNPRPPNARLEALARRKPAWESA
jgi:uncharacterized protein (DUF1778 family)